MNIPHIPVLLNEVKEIFLDINDGYIVDCTVGYGGHSEALLEQNPNIKLICCDQDAEAIKFSKKRLKRFALSFQQLYRSTQIFPYVVF